VLAFCAATRAYVVDPSLANDKVYLVVAMLAIFWGLTVANLFGMRWSARLNNPGVVLGTLLPAAVLIVLGVYWLSAGRHNQIPFHAGKLAPNLGSVNNLAFFVAVLLSYGGIEMAGFHARQTRNPARDYPRAIFTATALIVAVSILATLAIAFVVPETKLSLVAGLMQAFDAFFTRSDWPAGRRSGEPPCGTEYRPPVPSVNASASFSRASMRNLLAADEPRTDARTCSPRSSRSALRRCSSTQKTPKTAPSRTPSGTSRFSARRLACGGGIGATLRW
jgi:amino acid transporter